MFTGYANIQWLGTPFESRYRLTQRYPNYMDRGGFPSPVCYRIALHVWPTSFGNTPVGGRSGPSGGPGRKPIIALRGGENNDPNSCAENLFPSMGGIRARRGSNLTQENRIDGL